MKALKDNFRSRDETGDQHQVHGITQSGAGLMRDYRKLAGFAAALTITGLVGAAHAAVAPVVGDLGSILNPTNNANLPVNIGGAGQTGPLLVTFTLAETGDVQAGLKEVGGKFNTTGFNLIDLDTGAVLRTGTNVSFGSGPFNSSTLDWYVPFTNLAAGSYALEILGSGGGSGTDFITRVGVTPLPAALPLLGSALAGVGLLGFGRRRQAG